MTETRNIRSVLLKLARVVLVFALVFYTSLRVELLVAYAAEFDNVIEDNGTGHADASLTDLLVYQRAAGSDEWRPVKNARATGHETAKVGLTASEADRQFIVVPVWNDELPTGYNAGDGLKAAIYSATFVEWEMAPENASSVSVDEVSGKNVLILTPKANGTAEIKAKVKSNRSENLSVSFTVDVSGFGSGESESGSDSTGRVELKSVEILDQDGQVIDRSAESALVFSKDELPVTYQLNARVAVDGGVYDSTDDDALSEFSKRAQGDLKWTISPESDDASIDESGLLTVTGEGKFEVTCTASVNQEVSQQMSDRITVVAGNPQDESDDPQGPSHPQDTLHVVSQGALLSAALDSSGNDLSQDGVAAQDDDSDEGAAVTIDRLFSLEELKALEGLEFKTDTYTMSAGGSSVKVTGNGFALNDLLSIVFDEAGVNPATTPIESIDFVDYRGVATTIPYNFLYKTSTLIAVKSYVNVPQEGGLAGVLPGTDETTSDDDLLDNTRFRLLFNDDAATYDADSLRWINTIQINGPTQDSGEELVHIDYTPVPKGVDAEFVAVPEYDIAGSWNCIWEVSYDREDDGENPEESVGQLTDAGRTWTVLEGETGQTLRVPTNDNTVGTWYRVTIDNELPSGESNRSKPSAGVQLREGAGLVLSYTPPRAGDLAIFYSSVYGYDGDVSSFEYAWQWSNDGGKSWNLIGGETRPTLKIPTDPVDENADASEGEGGPSNLIYIRVRAIPPTGDPLVSNVQPLTVRVGDEDTDTSGGNDDSGVEDGENQPAGGEVNPPSGGPSSDGTTQQPTPTVTEIDNITIEYAPTPVEQLDPDSTETQQAAPQQTGTPTEIYVNDAVSDLVNEQQETVQEYLASTTPGVRWTALNTVNPTGDEVRRVLDGNPIAPLVIPFSLGTIAAGGLEKLLFFRRQLL